MRLIVSLILILISQSNWAQNEISWSGKYDSAQKKVLLTAKLAEGWHVYSMTVDEMSGPVSTKIELKKNKSIVVLSPVNEPEPIVSFDENFGAELQYFENSVTFEQELKIKKSTQLQYTITHMICNEVMCYPPVDEIILISVVK